MKSRSPLRFGVAVIAALALMGWFSGAAQADILLQYNFGSTSQLNPSSTDPNIDTATAIGATGFGTNPTDWGWSSGDQNLYVRATFTPAAQDAGDYFEFTFGPSSGFQMTLTNLTFDYLSQTAFAGFTTNLAVQSSAGGFGGSSLNLPSTPSLLTLTDNSSGSATIDLSGAEFQNLTSDVTFRVYVWDNNNSSNRITRLDNLTVNGAIAAVPEPPVYGGMVSALLIVLAALRYRTRRVIA